MTIPQTPGEPAVPPTRGHAVPAVLRARRGAGRPVRDLYLPGDRPPVRRHVPFDAFPAGGFDGPAGRHLWEYGSDEFPHAGSDIDVRFESWPELRDNVRRYLGPDNMVFSWFWQHPAATIEEDRGDSVLYLTVGMAWRTVLWWSPVDEGDEPEVRELLWECAALLGARWSDAVLYDEVDYYD